MPRTAAGSARCEATWPKVTTSLAASVSPPAGRTSSLRAKNQMASSPSQKAGAASRVYAAELTHRSSQPPGLRAARTPRPVPSRIATRKAVAASRTDQPMRSAMTSATGWRITLESPKSPWSAEVSQSHQRATSGWSTPRLSWLVEVLLRGGESGGARVGLDRVEGGRGGDGEDAEGDDAEDGDGEQGPPSRHPRHRPPGEASAHFFEPPEPSVDHFSTFHQGPEASPWSCGSTWVVRGPKRSSTT